LPLGQPADGGVAGHLADARRVHGDQRRPATEARGRPGGFRAGVAAADDDDVEFAGHWRAIVVAGEAGEEGICCGGVFGETISLVGANFCPDSP